MDSTKPDAVSVNILGKDYRIACAPDEEKALQKAAGLLDTRMKEIRQAGKVIGIDRIAVMAALNLAHDLLSKELRIDSEADIANKRIRALHERVQMVLNDNVRPES